MAKKATTKKATVKTLEATETMKANNLAFEWHEESNGFIIVSTL